MQSDVVSYVSIDFDRLILDGNSRNLGRSHRGWNRSKPWENKNEGFRGLSRGKGGFNQGTLGEGEF